MARRERLICAAADLVEAGRGVRFDVAWHGRREPAFAVRFEGEVHAFLNRCGHLPQQLDWLEGEFFDSSRQYLICATHGALYHPGSGACVGGRCAGRGLIPLPLIERDDHVYLMEDHE